MRLDEFLLAQIAELETRAADIHEAGCLSTWWEHDRLGYDPDECNCGDPARVLADCAAKRAIVAEHAPQNEPLWEGDDTPLICRTCEDRRDHDAALWPCKTLRLLAGPDTPPQD